MQRALITSVCLLILAWLALSASTWGIVVWQSKVFVSQSHGRPAISCTYFDGTALFQRGYLFSPDDRVGYARCPIWAPAMPP
ncbi:MAG: hypothetical protein KJ587_15000 [Alphaproteobacteria bacterium]|nr:hypothetical protein [Alphaproteobacteria bacterium]